MNAGDRAGRDEEVLDDLGDEPALLRLGRLPDEGAEVQLPLGQPLERRVGDLAGSASGSTSRTMRASMSSTVRRCAYISRKSFSSRFAGKHLADDVEDLVGAELVFDLGEAVEELLQHAALARVDRRRS